MIGTGIERKSEIFGRFGKALCVGILALGFSAGAFAQKGVYYGGYSYLFTASGGGLQAIQYARNGNGLAQQWSTTWSKTPIGSIGACVFNGLIYGFFTTATSDNGGTLYYVTVDPGPGHSTTGPTVIAVNLESDVYWTGGVAAVVAAGSIYCLLPGYSLFESGDGNSFCGQVTETRHGTTVLDAVTFYPTGDDPESIMLVFTDSGTLFASIISPVTLEATQEEFVLPWPPAAPYLWQPVVEGDLLLGTSGGFNNTPAGATAPSLQFYGLTGQGQDGIHQGRWEYNVEDQSWTFTDITSPNTLYLWALPWFDTVDQTKGTMRLSHFLSFSNNSANTFFVNPSDWMIPQNNDATYGWNGAPTATATAAGTELQNLWTLVGVVLGPPPFPMNGAANACSSSIDALAWVDYGKDTSTTVTTTSTSSSTISVAVDQSIKGGIYHGSLDLSYAHAWTSSHGTSKTVSVSQDFQFGPCSEQSGNQGTHGWAIFNAPTLVTQWYKLYAYDFNQSTGQGTYLNQDIYATALGATVQQTAYFNLANPSQGEYPGLFAGLTVYPNSTDLNGWHLNIPNWHDTGSNWGIVFGDTTSPQMPVLTLGERDEVSYTESTTTTDSKGNSNSFGVQAGAGFRIAGYALDVTMGYDGEWTTNTENESTITQNVSCALNVPIPSNTPGYVNSMTVQPYWLQATSTNAPWIPTGYNGDLPWCITWDVTQYGTVSGIGAGLASPPISTSGAIYHGGNNEEDGYIVSGGHMSWLDSNGTEMSMPLTADQFDPSKGASVLLNGHVFTAASNGVWSRNGDAWDFFTTNVGMFSDGFLSGGFFNDWFFLDLDFANGTWSFAGLSRTLDQDIKASDGSVRVSLALGGKYVFTGWLQHGVDIYWSHEEAGAAALPYGVDETQGEYHSQTGAGDISLTGHVPPNVGAFGDVEIRVNGVPVDFPLLSTQGFLSALTTGGQVTYQAEGLSFCINLGTGLWQAAISGTHFTSAMAPKDGAIRVQLLLGGKSISDQTLVLQNWTEALAYPYTTS